MTAISAVGLQVEVELNLAALRKLTKQSDNQHIPLVIYG